MMCEAVNPQPPPTVIAQTGLPALNVPKLASFFGSLKCGQHRFYPLRVEGGVISLELTWENGETDLDLVLYGPCGQDVDVSIHGRPEIIQHDTKGLAGEYTVEVIHFSGEDVVYNLSARYHDHKQEECLNW